MYYGKNNLTGKAGWIRESLTTPELIAWIVVVKRPKTDAPACAPPQGGMIPPVDIARSTPL